MKNYKTLMNEDYYFSTFLLSIIYTRAEYLYINHQTLANKIIHFSQLLHSDEITIQNTINTDILYGYFYFC
ncbi:hypothetical protein OFB72_28770, partial [Escherichia coli]|nr:hypothetical protein [Escherichia coli]